MLFSIISLYKVTWQQMVRFLSTLERSVSVDGGKKNRKRSGEALLQRLALKSVASAGLTVTRSSSFFRDVSQLKESRLKGNSEVD